MTKTSFGEELDALILEAMRRAYVGLVPDKVLVLRLPSHDGVEVQWMEVGQLGDLLDRISATKAEV